MPISPHRLAAGLLAVACVGIGPLVSLVAFAGLVVFGVQLGVGAALIAVPALALHLIFVVLLSRLAIGAAGAAMRTRLGLEFVAIQYAVLIALSAVGWVLLEFLGDGGERDGLAGWTTEGLPSSLATVVQALPSGWGPVAVAAAGDADWLAAGGVLLGQLVLIGVMLWAWMALLTRRLTTRSSGGTARMGLAASVRLARFLPATPLGAVIGRELRTWLREPRSAIEWRIAILAGLLIVVMPLAVGRAILLPWAGAVIAVMAGVVACNSYGLEGSALWLTLTAPGAERVDVRGKQWAFLLIFGPVVILSMLVFTVLSGQEWAWPWVLPVTPALLGGAAGLMMLVSVTGAAPVPETARRSGDLMAAADNTGPAFLTLIGVSLTALPAAGVVLADELLDSAVLRWAGLSVGIATGTALTWWCGRAAAQKLETGGPELLHLLRHGARTDDRAATGAWDWTSDLPPGIRGKIALVCWSLFWLPLLPQGIVPLVFKLFGIEVRSWFLALYLPPALQWPTIIAMIPLGLIMIYVAVTIQRDYDRAKIEKESLATTPSERTEQTSMMNDPTGGDHQR